MKFFEKINLDFFKMKKILEFLKKNYLISILFFLSTIFFLFQHFSYLGWDFSAYVINAKYLFVDNHYFEVYRAPMVSFIIGIFSFLGKFSEYVFILIVSSLFFVSSIKLSDVLHKNYFYKFKIDKKLFRFLFYFFNLNIFVFTFGIIEGTELLALSFFQLFIYTLISKKVSGHYLALAVLTRYNFLMFIPFLFFSKDIKKIFKNFITFVIVLFPWLLFNFLKWGNWFTSIADSYYLNVISRQTIAQVFNFSSLFFVINFFLPFFLLGIYVFFKKVYLKKFKFLKYDFLFILIFVFLLIDVITTPFKIKRYLFNFVLPITYFSISGITFIINKFKKKDSFLKILKIILLIFFVLMFIFMICQVYKMRKGDEIFSESSKTIKELNLENCKIVSPHWVPVNYYSKNVYFLDEINSSLKRNEIVLIFYNNPTFDDKFTKKDLEKYSYLFKNNNYLLISGKNVTNKNCAKVKDYDSPIRKDSCEILSTKFEKIKTKNLFLKICKLINFS